MNFIRPIENTLIPHGLNTNKNKIRIANSERQLLEMFLTEMEKIDPDLLVGHNFLGFSASLLCMRLKTLKIAGWSILGKLRRTEYFIFF